MDEKFKGILLGGVGIIVLISAFMIGVYTIKKLSPPPQPPNPVTDTTSRDSTIVPKKDSIPISQPTPPIDKWITSDVWPYGKWKGGIRDSMPHGNDTVIYLEAIEYPTTNFREQKIEKGYKVIGVYKDGDLIEGDIYDQNGKFIKKINTPTL